MQNTALTELRGLVTAVRERWMVAFLLAAAIAGSAAVFLLTRPPVYAARAAIVVEPSDEVVLEVTDVVKNEVQRELLDAFLRTHVDTLKTRPFLELLASKLSEAEIDALFEPYDLKTAGEGDEPARTSALSSWKNILKAFLLPGRQAVSSEEEKLLHFLGDHLTPKNVDRTMLIGIEMTHRDPEMAQLVANKAAESYLEYSITGVGSRVDSANTFLGNQAAELKARISEMESELQAFRVGNNLAAIKDRQNFTVTRLAQINTALADTNISLIQKAIQLQQAEGLYEAGRARELSLMRYSEEFGEILRELDQAKVAEETLAMKYGPRHPLRRQNKARLEELESIVTSFAFSVFEDYRMQLAIAEEIKQELEGELKQIETESFRLDQLSATYEAKERELNTTKATYMAVVAREQETALSRQLSTTNIRFVDPASLPLKPFAPSSKKIFIVTFVLGGGLFFGYPIGMGFIDSRLRTWQDLSPDQKLPLLTEIPAARGKAKAAPTKVVQSQSSLPIVEAFREMQQRLDASSRAESAAKMILVTSTSAGEGKSFVASNYAAVCARHGKRTLLIDADFRRPKLHTVNKLKNDAGILPWLNSGATSIGADLLENGDLGMIEIEPGLYLLRTGGTSSQISEHLETTVLPQLLERLREDFDRIIVDTPPAGLFPDAKKLSEHCDDAVFVCRFNRIQRERAQKVLNRFTDGREDNVWIVMNGMPTNRAGAIYYTGYGYSAKEYKSYSSGAKRDAASA